MLRLRTWFPKGLISSLMLCWSHLALTVPPGLLAHPWAQPAFGCSAPRAVTRGPEAKPSDPAPQPGPGPHAR